MVCVYLWIFVVYLFIVLYTARAYIRTHAVIVDLIQMQIYIQIYKQFSFTL